MSGWPIGEITTRRPTAGDCAKPERASLPFWPTSLGGGANAISGDVLTSYVQHRQVAGLANGTINRELSVLGKAFKLGLEHGKVLRRPVIHLLKEARPRHRGTGIL